MLLHSRKKKITQQYGDTPSLLSGRGRGTTRDSTHPPPLTEIVNMSHSNWLESRAWATAVAYALRAAGWWVRLNRDPGAMGRSTLCRAVPTRRNSASGVQRQCSRHSTHLPRPDCRPMGCHHCTRRHGGESRTDHRLWDRRLWDLRRLASVERCRRRHRRRVSGRR